MNKEEAAKVISEKVGEAIKLLDEARKLAKENRVAFYVEDCKYDDLLSQSEWETIGGTTGWMPSSALC